MAREEQHQPEKRTRMRGEERRALMLQSAKHVFARLTYAQASTGELARESEVTEPMLYKHFGSKKGLFLAVLSELGTQFFQMFQERVSQHGQILDVLSHILDDYRATIKADPEMQRILFQSIAESGDPEIGRYVGIHNREIYGFIRQLVERGQQEGYLDAAVDLDAAAWGYMSMILALQYGMMLDLSRDVALAQGEMSRIWLRGLRSHEE